MTDSSLDDVVRSQIDRINKSDTDAEAAAEIKNLKLLAEAKQILNPPIPEPEIPLSFLRQHAGDLIKAAATLSAVGLIAVIEAKGDIIFRSKATKYL